MQVMLDNEQWTVNDNTSLMEILAQVSDKAFAQNRVVIALQVGERRMTDRDLTPTQLGPIGAGMGPVRATTQSMTQIIDGGDASMRLFAGLLKSDALGIVQAIRAGRPPAGLFDAWLGRLADYLECEEAKVSQAAPGISLPSLAPWVARLLEVRIAADWVGVADVVEYEIVARLPG